jgi:2-aminoethylphosphonate-pyruvate transaminase
MTSESVRQAGAAPDLNHRDPQYINMIREIERGLLGIYPSTASWSPYLIGGSGTAAVEAMITSCIVEGPCLILANGYYSERLAAIFEIYKIPHRTLRWDWLSAWSFEQIEDELAGVRYEAVLGTHNETTTGRLNDVAKLGELCRKYGAKCLIDAMSSFGGDELEARNLDAVCASSNKCLHGIPGVSFVLSSLDLAEVPRRSYYLSLAMYAGESPPLTPPVPAMAALRQALREMPGDRIDQYRLKSAFVRGALPNLKTAIPIEESSNTVTTFQAPEGWTAQEFIEANREAGFLLYGCKGMLDEQYFQASVMGEVSMEMLERWVRTVEKLLRH